MGHIRSHALVAALVLLGSESALADQLLLTTYYGGRTPDGVANKEYPRGTCLLITNTQTGVTVRGVVNDYGPNAKWAPERKLDVAEPLARRLNMISKGKMWTRVKKC